MKPGGYYRTWRSLLDAPAYLKGRPRIKILCHALLGAMDGAGRAQVRPTPNPLPTGSAALADIVGSYGRQYRRLLPMLSAATSIVDGRIMQSGAYLWVEFDNFHKYQSRNRLFRYSLPETGTELCRQYPQTPADSVGAEKLNRRSRRRSRIGERTSAAPAARVPRSRELTPEPEPDTEPTSPPSPPSRRGTPSANTRSGPAALYHAFDRQADANGLKPRDSRRLAIRSAIGQALNRGPDWWDLEALTTAALATLHQLRKGHMPENPYAYLTQIARAEYLRSCGQRLEAEHRELEATPPMPPEVAAGLAAILKAAMPAVNGTAPPATQPPAPRKDPLRERAREIIERYDAEQTKETT